METVKTESPHTHLPNNTLLMPIQSMQPGDDTVMMEVEESSIYNRKDAPSLPSIKNLPSLATASHSADDFIRHRMSDMSVSQLPLRQHALEPNSHHPLYESFSRRGSLTDPAAFYSRRPSIADPIVSRRGSTTTDYSSRSPSPSPFSRRYPEEGHSLSRQPSFHTQLPTNPLYDPFQRRHSIAEPLRNAPTPPKAKVFRFPAPIPETQQYESSSAPPSPPPIPQGVIRRKASLMAEESYLPARRASMPLVVPSEKVDSKDMPYARSPALRVSHKLAERKRRKEMKFLFDDLRDALPVEKDMKTSKWEILSKAIDYISLLKRRDSDLETEINELRREIDIIKRSK